MKTVRIISLGSGDPNNITLKALKALEDSDLIFVPNGEAVKVVTQLSRRYDLSDKLESFGIPMQKNPDAAAAVYHKISERIRLDSRPDKKFAIVTIGDAGIYSSAYKIVDILNSEDIRVEVLPGVPSFVVGMASARIPLIAQGENLAVLSEIQSEDHLLGLLKNGMTVVVMKLSIHQDLIKRILQKEHFTFIYMEKLGADDQFITCDLSELLDRHFPYFSIITIKPNLTV